MTPDELLAHCSRVHYLPYDDAPLAVALIKGATGNFEKYLRDKHDNDHKWMRENPSQTVLPNHSHPDVNAPGYGVTLDNIPF